MALDCPRCQEIELEEIEIGDVVVDRCPRCAGIWFDNAEIGEIVGREPKAKNFDSIIPDDPVKNDEFACPRCPGVSLRKLVFEVQENQPSIFYRCVSCIGTWLDRGELRIVEDKHLGEVLKSFFHQEE